MIVRVCEAGRERVCKNNSGRDKGVYQKGTGVSVVVKTLDWF